MPGYNKKGCKIETVVLPPKPPCKKGRPRKTPVVGSSLIDEDIDTPVNDVRGSGYFDDGGSSDVRGCGQFGVRKGRWFGLGENDNESDPIENSEVPQETNQNAANDSIIATQETRHFSDTAFASSQTAKTIKPRPRSERILKKQLAKKVHGIGSTSSNALNLE
ncbi:hypothetical protein Tco_1088839 [Tanacetum coccineum]